ncbi:sigma-70 family RNA polymerase sigma factor [Streptacidiphilus sp. 4-A2]|nr:sigma-70 family RNA polymerase sigma factor [Streptacidiphilus sp. 4-A2]
MTGHSWPAPAVDEWVDEWVDGEVGQVSTVCRSEPAAVAPGFPEDFAALYREQRSALVWYVRSQGATEPEACDAVQDAFAAALRAAGRIRDRRAWPAWLRTVAVRSYLRSVSVHGRSREGHDGRALSAAAGDPAEARREEEFVLSVLAALPAQQRRVFTLHYEGWSTAEIAVQLDMERAAVRQNIARARRTLKALVTPREPG